MAHIPYELWERYVKGQLDNTERKKCEDHLYQCDRCMDDYIAVLEQCQEDLPDLGGDLFSDEMYATVVQTYSGRQDPNRTTQYKKTMYHYLIAAGFTIILLSTGVFQSMTEYVGAVHETALSEERTSLTDRMLEQTFTVWQSLEQENDGGESNE